MLFNGQTLMCVESFFIFEKGQRYYCTHTCGEFFFIANRGSKFNVGSFKIPFSHAKKFKVLL